MLILEGCCQSHTIRTNNLRNFHFFSFIMIELSRGYYNLLSYLPINILDQSNCVITRIYSCLKKCPSRCSFHSMKIKCTSLNGQNFITKDRDLSVSSLPMEINSKLILIRLFLCTSNKPTLSNINLMSLYCNILIRVLLVSSIGNYDSSFNQNQIQLRCRSINHQSLPMCYSQ